MELKINDLKKITFGAINIIEKEDGIHFYKCTQKQVDAWYSNSQSLGLRAETTTGIRFDFVTDATYMELELVSGKFEVFLNGVFVESYNQSTKINLSGTNRVTILMSSHEVTVFKSVSLSDCASITPHRFDTKILFMGDSITQGWESGLDYLSYAMRITNMLNANSVVNGVGGGYFDPDTFDIINFDPDTVIIAYGTNDWGHYKTKEDLIKNADGFLKKIKDNYGNKKVYCITPIWRESEGETKAMGTFYECIDIVSQIIDKYGFNKIDGFTLVPHRSDYYTDGLHPNAIGFSLYAENLIKVLGK